MLHSTRWRATAGIGVLAGAAILCAHVLATPAFASGGPVSTTPAAGTPELDPNSGAPSEEINVLKQCGSTIYAGGTFSTILQNGTSFTRHNLFSFSATAPYKMTSWAPDVNGNVQTLAFDGGNCSHIYVGGSFSKIGSTTADNVAEVSTSSGSVNTAFGHDANGEVDTMIVHGSHVLTGGTFTSINGSGNRYYTSLNYKTGKNDGYLSLHISGHYEYSGVSGNATRVYAQQASHAGARVMVEGDFTSVGGKARQQVFQLWLSSSRGEVTGWNAPVFNTHCITREPMYAKSVAWAPNDNTVYVATTGDHKYLWSNTYPLPEPCDMALAFSANESAQSPKWINATGCDSLLSVMADNSAVYFAGHPRWSQNDYGCNADGGHGAIQDYGMEGLNPSTGRDLLNSSGQPKYTMSRANGQYMMMSTAGLWIGSTNRFGDQTCNGVSGHSGICFLPYN